MDLLLNFKTVIGFLRGDPNVTSKQFKEALRALIDAGMSWWIDLTEPVATTCLCDTSNVAEVCDYLESHVRLMESHANGVGAVEIPWNLILTVLVDLLRQWLNK